MSTRGCFALAVALASLALAVGCGGEDEAGSAAEISTGKAPRNPYGTSWNRSLSEIVEKPGPGRADACGHPGRGKGSGLRRIGGGHRPGGLPLRRRLRRRPAAALAELQRAARGDGDAARDDQHGRGDQRGDALPVAAAHCGRTRTRCRIREREALTALLGEDGLRVAFTEDYGYVALRLGILADGTWWFLVWNPFPCRRRPSGGCVSLRRA